MSDIPNYYDIIREFGVPSEERPPLPQSKRKWFGSEPWDDRHPAWQLAAMHERHRAARTERNMVEEIVRLRRIEAPARRVVMAQEQMGQGSWLPSEAACAELDAAWAELRAALGMTPDPEAA